MQQDTTVAIWEYVEVFIRVGAFVHKNEKVPVSFVLIYYHDVKKSQNPHLCDVTSSYSINSYFICGGFMRRITHM